MKYFLSIGIVFSFVLNCLGQGQDIEVFEKKDGNKNIVIARNIGKVSYFVTVSITAKGMDVSPGMKVQAVVPAGYMKEMATLVPRPGEAWSYGYEISFMEYTGQTSLPSTTAESTGDTNPAPSTASQPPLPTSSSISLDALVVYTQAGCGRCAFVKKELATRGIEFQEIDVNGGSPEAGNMWVDLRNAGFTGTSVTMPVVRSKGKLHYNIKDLNGFVDGLK